jgi:zinc D-Ala-D-Ala carboxypeptidase
VRPDRFVGLLSAVAVVATGITVTSGATEAQASVPAVATTYQSLMYRSLTATATTTALRKTLTEQRATATTRTAAMSAAQTASNTAQLKLTASATADATATEVYATSVDRLATAQEALATALRARPRSKAAIAAAEKQITTASTTVTARKTQAATAETTLVTAQTGAKAAATTLANATTLATAASGAVTTTQQKIVAVGTAADWARQARALGQTVVTTARPAFTIADTTQVYSTTVHKSVAYAYKRMIDDATAAGVPMSGGGFRTKERQIQLRTINGCPNVYTAPASSCRVPTAIPGRSLHELGLAVDITAGGKTISANTPAFRWLKAHAAAYGYINLPSEPWHWSITGG